MKKFLSIMAIIILCVLIVTGILIYCNLPTMLEYYLDIKNSNTEEIFNVMLLLLYFAGVPAILMLALAVMLSINVLKNRPFVLQNVILLKCIGGLCLLIALAFIIVTPMMASFFPPILAMAFIVLSLLMFIVGNLFKIAIKYKEENDLTI